MIRAFTILISTLFISFGLKAQKSEIQLINPSFDGIPHSGGEAIGGVITGWQDCGFVNETPPDIHASGNRVDPSFGVTAEASDGMTFLGMVARDNDTYESVSQRLEKPLEAGKCYEFSIDLCKSGTYVSPFPPSSKSKAYTKPIVLRIYGGTSHCSNNQLLGESEPIDNTDWKTFTFTFKPTKTLRYFKLAAFYKVPILWPYNGNILLDNATAIKEVPCPDQPVEEIVAEQPVEKEIKKEEKKVTVVKEEPVKKDPVLAEKEIVKEVPAFDEPKVTINKELNRKFLRKGQTIKIKNLFFDADSVVINPKSIPALNELAEFLKYYKDVRIEIGGHTNGRPPHEFCDSLSTARAKNVAQYLYDRGIPLDQVEYKGYGKRNPVASDKYAEGRRRNQRVEIKVLEIDS